MFCKIFSDDKEIATNQKIGLCDYLRTEWPYWYSRTIEVAVEISVLPAIDRK
eukprot:COSAG05_NODE_1357_length_5103_cov_38.859313_5_plen_52_part_00